MFWLLFSIFVLLWGETPQRLLWLMLDYTEYSITDPFFQICVMFILVLKLFHNSYDKKSNYVSNVVHGK